jgi:hypothetical protein
MFNFGFAVFRSITAALLAALFAGAVYPPEEAIQRSPICAKTG